MRGRKPAAASHPPASFDVDIERIGSAGDGVSADRAGARVHVPRTLPGELVRVEAGAGGRRASLLDVLRPSPDRVAPPCPHFDQGCGGCALQHWTDEAYAAWKRGLVTEALVRAGLPDPQVAPLVRTPPHARRRMDFAVERSERGVVLGLHRAHDQAIVDVSAPASPDGARAVVCEILHPALLALLDPLRQALSGLAALRRRGSVLANLAVNGPDLLIRTDGPLAPTDRVKLAAMARQHGVARIAWSLDDGPSEAAALLNTPFAEFGGHRVELPPGAFLQASAEGEAAIVGAVLAGLPDKLTGRSRAVELYAGCGTISFPLASRLRVQAFEGDAGAAQAVRRAQTGSHVEMTQRDLARQPLSAKEMAGAAVVVLDPPYAGSAMQVPLIAASRVPRVIYVSCNPGVLARDAATLAQAGYRLLNVTPIDQFLWSAQVESVAVFTLN